MTTSASSEPVLSARGVALSRRGVRILDGASLDVGRGEIATIEGPSGSGKSTLLRVLAGLVTPDLGEVALAGTPIRAIAPEVHRRRVGYVAQTPQMLSGTVADEVRTGPRFRGEELDDARVRALLDRAALDAGLAARPSRDLSGGERLRVALARALANEPEALLLDEPTAPLDPDTASRILDLVRTLAEGGLAIVVVTHSAEHADALAGTRYVCAAGKLSLRGARA